MPKRHTLLRGFTIVELLIVIVVIGVLAGITTAIYTGLQKRARDTSYISTLSHISKLMEIHSAATGHYPDTLPDDIVQAGHPYTLRLVSGDSFYENLSPVQRGVLLHDICTTLISEGFGRGTTQDDQEEQYISSCNVYGSNAMQINGWHSRSFTTPIAATDIHDWYNSNVNEESWRPGKKQAHLDFANELRSRYTSSGGSFPITSFWDPWGGSSPREDLPEPTVYNSNTSYCIEIAHSSRENEVWHVRQNGIASEGAC